MYSHVEEDMPIGVYWFKE